MISPKTFTFSPIGIVHSCYKEKFGIPRQPGLVTAATSYIELLPPYNRLDTLDGLEGFSHIWVQFVFHVTMSEKWKAKVRPPRLGGKRKTGIFATRSTHRPNPIGLSVVKIGSIHKESKKIFIDLYGADLLDGTPVLDIKPYLPYADSIKSAKGGFAAEAGRIHLVLFSEIALQQCKNYESLHYKDIHLLIKQIIQQDPRPSHLSGRINKEYGMRLWDLNIRWQAHDEYFEVMTIEKIEEKEHE